MDSTHSKYVLLETRLAFRGVLAAFALVLASPGMATAQQETYVDFSHPNVTVDLSVIEGGGYQQAPGVGAMPLRGSPGGLSGFKLLLPGSQAPTSMLHLPTVSGETLVLPKKQKAVQPSPAPATAVVKQAAAPKPAEITAAAKKIDPPTKPAAPTVIAASKAPPPAPVVEAAPKVVKTQAPVAPPPPPTPSAQKIAPAQQAALPASIQPGQAMQVMFGPKQAKLPDQAKEGLVALAKRMKGQENIRLQLMAYAGGPKLSSSLARRLSLSRALSIRSFLIESGVRSTRIDVRALGNKTKEEPVNRVDLNITER